VRVVQIIDSLWVGGAEKLQVTFARAATEHGLKASLIVLRNYPGTPIPEQVREAGAEIIELDARRLTDPRRFLKLLHYLRREKVEVIHAHLTYAILLGTLAARLSGIPIVASIHNTEPDHWGKLEIFFLRHLVQRVIAVGTAIAEAYQPKLGNKAIEIVANPVAAVPAIGQEQINSLRASLMGDPSRPFVLTVGRLEPQKGLPDLLEAAARVRQHVPNVFFAIAGTGTLKDELNSQIESLGLSGTVQLLGVRDDIPALLAACDTFVISSHWEGLPIAMLEAMSAGRPIVATSVGDIPNVLNAQSGLLVPPRKPEELAAAIQSMLADPQRAQQMGQAARQYVEQNHSPAAWLEHLYQIYAQVAQKTQQRPNP
jgi:glycosyltransferase involved in cell wall biosynthesis